MEIVKSINESSTILYAGKLSGTTGAHLFREHQGRYKQNFDNSRFKQSWTFL